MGGRGLWHGCGSIIVAGVLLSGCTNGGSDGASSAPEQADGSGPVVIAPTVVVDAFSGQPNPTFELSRDAVTTVESKLGDVVAAGPVAGDQAPSGLGFRGFQLSTTDTGQTVITPDGVWLDGAHYDDPDESLYLELRQLALANDPGLADVIPVS